MGVVWLSIIIALALCLSRQKSLALENNKRSTAPDVSRLALWAATSVGPIGTCSCRSDRSLLTQAFGGTALKWAGATQVFMSRNPTNQTVPSFRSVVFLWLASLGLKTVEVVAGVGSEITYRVSWGIETAERRSHPRP